MIDPDADLLRLRAAAGRYEAELLAWIAAWERGETDSAGDRARWDACARSLFALQREAIAPYAARCAGVPAQADWPQAPWLPVTALKRYACQVPWAIDAPTVRFETSGTTDGAPGVVRLASTRLYDAALCAGVRRQLLGPAPVPRYRVLSLVPDAGLRPHASLGHMVDVVRDAFGDGQGGSFLGVPPEGANDPQGEPAGLRLQALETALQRAIDDDAPVLLLTTTIALELWQQARSERAPMRLPAGSRVMDTGGPKGRRVQASRAEQRHRLCRDLGLRPEHVVAELGMTELASQRYELPGGDPDAPRYVGPPWLRSVVLDVATLQPASPGETGLVAHIDLANLETAAFLLTADLGRLSDAPGGDSALQLAGRLPGSEWRGCGLVAEEFLP